MAAAGRDSISRRSLVVWGRFGLFRSLVYAVVHRLLELIVLLARGERSKEPEIIVLRHELSLLRR